MLHLDQEKSTLFQENFLSPDPTKCWKKQVNLQLVSKVQAEHQEKMAKFGLHELALVANRASRNRNTMTNGRTLKAKKHFQTWNYKKQRELQKEKEELRREGGYQSQEGEESESSNCPRRTCSKTKP
jgi:hypothetical protein